MLSDKDFLLQYSTPTTPSPPIVSPITTPTISPPPQSLDFQLTDKEKQNLIDSNVATIRGKTFTKVLDNKGILQGWQIIGDVGVNLGDTSKLYTPLEIGITKPQYATPHPPHVEIQPYKPPFIPELRILDESNQQPQLRAMEIPKEIYTPELRAYEGKPLPEHTITPTEIASAGVQLWTKNELQKLENTPPEQLGSAVDNFVENVWTNTPIGWARSIFSAIKAPGLTEPLPDLLWRRVLAEKRPVSTLAGQAVGTYLTLATLGMAMPETPFVNLGKSITDVYKGGLTLPKIITGIARGAPLFGTQGLFESLSNELENSRITGNPINIKNIAGQTTLSTIIGAIWGGSLPINNVVLRMTSVGLGTMAANLGYNLVKDRNISPDELKSSAINSAIAVALMATIKGQPEWQRIVQENKLLREGELFNKAYNIQLGYEVTADYINKLEGSQLTAEDLMHRIDKTLYEINKNDAMAHWLDQKSSIWTPKERATIKTNATTYAKISQNLMQQFNIYAQPSAYYEIAKDIPEYGLITKDEVLTNKFKNALSGEISKVANEKITLEDAVKNAIEKVKPDIEIKFPNYQSPLISPPTPLTHTETVNKVANDEVPATLVTNDNAIAIQRAKELGLKTFVPQNPRPTSIENGKLNLTNIAIIYKNKEFNPRTLIDELNMDNPDYNKIAGQTKIPLTDLVKLFGTPFNQIKTTVTSTLQSLGYTPEQITQLNPNSLNSDWTKIARIVNEKLAPTVLTQGIPTVVTEKNFIPITEATELKPGVTIYHIENNEPWQITNIGTLPTPTDVKTVTAPEKVYYLTNGQGKKINVNTDELKRNYGILPEQPTEIKSASVGDIYEVNIPGIGRGKIKVEVTKLGETPNDLIEVKGLDKDWEGKKFLIRPSVLHPEQLKQAAQEFIPMTKITPEVRAVYRKNKNTWIKWNGKVYGPGTIISPVPKVTGEMMVFKTDDGKRIEIPFKQIQGLKLPDHGISLGQDFTVTQPEPEQPPSKIKEEVKPSGEITPQPQLKKEPGVIPEKAETDNTKVLDWIEKNIQLNPHGKNKNATNRIKLFSPLTGEVEGHIKTANLKQITLVNENGYPVPMNSKGKAVPIPLNSITWYGRAIDLKETTITEIKANIPQPEKQIKRTIKEEVNNNTLPSDMLVLNDVHMIKAIYPDGSVKWFKTELGVVDIHNNIPSGIIIEGTYIPQNFPKDLQPRPFTQAELSTFQSIKDKLDVTLLTDPSNGEDGCPIIVRFSPTSPLYYVMCGNMRWNWIYYLYNQTPRGQEFINKIKELTSRYNKDPNLIDNFKQPMIIRFLTELMPTDDVIQLAEILNRAEERTVTVEMKARELAKSIENQNIDLDVKQQPVETWSKIETAIANGQLKLLWNKLYKNIPVNERNEYFTEVVARDKDGNISSQALENSQKFIELVKQVLIAFTFGDDGQSILHNMTAKISPDYKILQQAIQESSHIFALAKANSVNFDTMFLAALSAFKTCMAEKWDAEGYLKMQFEGTLPFTEVDPIVDRLNKALPSIKGGKEYFIDLVNGMLKNFRSYPTLKGFFNKIIPNYIDTFQGGFGYLKGNYNKIAPADETPTDDTPEPSTMLTSKEQLPKSEPQPELLQPRKSTLEYLEKDLNLPVCFIPKTETGDREFASLSSVIEELKKEYPSVRKFVREHNLADNSKIILIVDGMPDDLVQDALEHELAHYGGRDIVIAGKNSGDIFSITHGDIATQIYPILLKYKDYINEGQKGYIRVIGKDGLPKRIETQHDIMTFEFPAETDKFNKRRILNDVWAALRTADHYYNRDVELWANAFSKFCNEPDKMKETVPELYGAVKEAILNNDYLRGYFIEGKKFEPLPGTTFIPEFTYSIFNLVNTFSPEADETTQKETINNLLTGTREINKFDLLPEIPDISQMVNTPTNDIMAMFKSLTANANALKIILTKIRNEGVRKPWDIENWRKEINNRISEARSLKVELERQLWNDLTTYGIRELVKNPKFENYDRYNKDIELNPDSQQFIIDLIEVCTTWSRSPFTFQQQLDELIHEYVKFGPLPQPENKLSIDNRNLLADLVEKGLIKSWDYDDNNGKLIAKDTKDNDVIWEPVNGTIQDFHDFVIERNKPATELKKETIPKSKPTLTAEPEQKSLFNIIREAVYITERGKPVERLDPETEQIWYDWKQALRRKDIPEIKKLLEVLKSLLPETVSAFGDIRSGEDILSEITDVKTQDAPLSDPTQEVSEQDVIKVTGATKTPKLTKKQLEDLKSTIKFYDNPAPAFDALIDNPDLSFRTNMYGEMIVGTKDDLHKFTNSVQGKDWGGGKWTTPSSGIESIGGEEQWRKTINDIMNEFIATEKINPQNLYKLPIRTLDDLLLTRNVLKEISADQYISWMIYSHNINRIQRILRNNVVTYNFVKGIQSRYLSLRDEDTNELQNFLINILMTGESTMYENMTPEQLGRYPDAIISTSSTPGGSVRPDITYINNINNLYKLAPLAKYKYPIWISGPHSMFEFTDEPVSVLVEIDDKLFNDMITDRIKSQPTIDKIVSDIRKHNDNTNIMLFTTTMTKINDVDYVTNRRIFSLKNSNEILESGMATDILTDAQPLRRLIQNKKIEVNTHEHRWIPKAEMIGLLDDKLRKEYNIPSSVKGFLLNLTRTPQYRKITPLGEIRSQFVLRKRLIVVPENSYLNLSLPVGLLFDRLPTLMVNKDTEITYPGQLVNAIRDKIVNQKAVQTASTALGMGISEIPIADITRIVRERNDLTPVEMAHDVVDAMIQAVTDEKTGYDKKLNALDYNILLTQLTESLLPGARIVTGTLDDVEHYWVETENGLLIDASNNTVQRIETAIQENRYVVNRKTDFQNSQDYKDKRDELSSKLNKALRLISDIDTTGFTLYQFKLKSGTKVNLIPGDVIQISDTNGNIFTARFRYILRGQYLNFSPIDNSIRISEEEYVDENSDPIMNTDEPKHDIELEVVPQHIRDIPGYLDVINIISKSSLIKSYVRDDFESLMTTNRTHDSNVAYEYRRIVTDIIKNPYKFRSQFDIMDLLRLLKVTKTARPIPNLGTGKWTVDDYSENFVTFKNEIDQTIKVQNRNIFISEWGSECLLNIIPTEQTPLGQEAVKKIISILSKQPNAALMGIFDKDGITQWQEKMGKGNYYTVHVGENTYAGIALTIEPLDPSLHKKFNIPLKEIFGDETGAIDPELLNKISDKVITGAVVIKNAVDFGATQLIGNPYAWSAGLKGRTKWLVDKILQISSLAEIDMLKGIKEEEAINILKQDDKFRRDLDEYKKNNPGWEQTQRTFGELMNELEYKIINEAEDSTDVAIIRNTWDKKFSQLPEVYYRGYKLWWDTVRIWGKGVIVRTANMKYGCEPPANADFIIAEKLKRLKNKEEPCYWLDLSKIERDPTKPKPPEPSIPQYLSETQIVNKFGRSDVAYVTMAAGSGQNDILGYISSLNRVVLMVRANSTTHAKAYADYLKEIGMISFVGQYEEVTYEANQIQKIKILNKLDLTQLPEKDEIKNSRITTKIASQDISIGDEIEYTDKGYNTWTGIVGNISLNEETKQLEITMHEGGHFELMRLPEANEELAKKFIRDSNNVIGILNLPSFFRGRKETPWSSIMAVDSPEAIRQYVDTLTRYEPRLKGILDLEPFMDELVKERKSIGAGVFENVIRTVYYTLYGVSGMTATEYKVYNEMIKDKHLRAIVADKPFMIRNFIRGLSQFEYFVKLTLMNLGFLLINPLQPLYNWWGGDSALLLRVAVDYYGAGGPFSGRKGIGGEENLLPFFRAIAYRKIFDPAILREMTTGELTKTQSKVGAVLKGGMEFEEFVNGTLTMLQFYIIHRVKAGGLSYKDALAEAKSGKLDNDALYYAKCNVGVFQGARYRSNDPRLMQRTITGRMAFLFRRWSSMLISSIYARFAHPESFILTPRKTHGGGQGQPPLGQPPSGGDYGGPGDYPGDEPNPSRWKKAKFRMTLALKMLMLTFLQGGIAAIIISSLMPQFVKRSLQKWAREHLQLTGQWAHDLALAVIAQGIAGAAGVDIASRVSLLNTYGFDPQKFGEMVLGGFYSDGLRITSGVGKYFKDVQQQNLKFPKGFMFLYETIGQTLQNPQAWANLYWMIDELYHKKTISEWKYFTRSLDIVGQPDFKHWSSNVMGLPTTNTNMGEMNDIKSEKATDGSIYNISLGKKGYAIAAHLIYLHNPHDVLKPNPKELAKVEYEWDKYKKEIAEYNSSHFKSPIDVNSLTFYNNSMLHYYEYYKKMPDIQLSVMRTPVKYIDDILQNLKNSKDKQAYDMYVKLNAGKAGPMVWLRIEEYWDRGMYDKIQEQFKKDFGTDSLGLVIKKKYAQSHHK